MVWIANKETGLDPINSDERSPCYVSSVNELQKGTLPFISVQYILGQKNIYVFFRFPDPT